jgi:hypothetical protein
MINLIFFLNHFSISVIFNIRYAKIFSYGKITPGYLVAIISGMLEL